MVVRFPKTLAAWCMFLFFLVFGITVFWSFSHSNTVLGVLALATALLTIIGR